MVETGTFRIGSLISTLNFHVVYFSCAVYGDNIESCAASIKILCRTLGDNFFDDDIIASKENTEQQLHPRVTAVKADIEEGIIDKAKLFNEF